MGEIRIIIAGSRKYNDYHELETRLKWFLWKEQIKRSQLIIISGHCKKGADALGEKFAKKYGVRLKEMPADWDTYGRCAGHIRNEKMARFAKQDSDRAILFAFWDGKSKGTINMISNANKYNLECNIYNYIKKKRFVTRRNDIMITYGEADFTDIEIENGDKVYRGIFIDCRVDPTTVPEGKFMYEIRHEDDDDSCPATIENKVTVNFYGTFITDNLIIIDERITIDDWGFLT